MTSQKSSMGRQEAASSGWLHNIMCGIQKWKSRYIIFKKTGTRWYLRAQHLRMGRCSIFFFTERQKG